MKQAPETNHCLAPPLQALGRLEARGVVVHAAGNTREADREVTRVVGVDGLYVVTECAQQCCGLLDGGMRRRTQLDLAEDRLGRDPDAQGARRSARGFDKRACGWRRRVWVAVGRAHDGIEEQGAVENAARERAELRQAMPVLEARHQRDPSALWFQAEESTHG